MFQLKIIIIHVDFHNKIMQTIIEMIVSYKMIDAFFMPFNAIVIDSPFVLPFIEFTK